MKRAQWSLLKKNKNVTFLDQPAIKHHGKVKRSTLENMLSVSVKAVETFSTAGCGRSRPEISLSLHYQDLFFSCGLLVAHRYCSDHKLYSLTQSQCNLWQAAVTSVEVHLIRPNLLKISKRK